jgi:hypothetical protein
MIISNYSNYVAAQCNNRASSHNTCHLCGLESISVPHIRSWRSVACRNRIITPSKTWIIRIVCSGERDKRSWFSTSAVSHFDLRTGQIHLCATDILRLVQCDGFYPDKILARRRAFGNGEGYTGLLWFVLGYVH